jgi:hypothetical protein
MAGSVGESVIVTRKTFLNAGGFESAAPDIAVHLAGGNMPVTEALAQLDHVAFELANQPGPDDVMVAPRDRLTAIYQSYVAAHAADTGAIRPLPAGGYEATFDARDPNWIGRTGLPWIRHYLEMGRHPWQDTPGPVDIIPNTCRIAVLGDWGTGLYGAPHCAFSIEQDGTADVLLHLGDVYYIGTDDEIRTRFLSHWPKVGRAVTRCAIGNHEMFSGGTGYFSMLPMFGQSGSYFAMQNDHWLLVGLDTAYSDHELAGDQITWLTDLLRHSGERKVVLFSHHQPFSLFSRPARRLLRQMSPFLEARRIFAWYWGHEHWCVIFEQHRQWRMYGRCVGHSGFPEFREWPFAAPDSPTFVHRPGRGALTPSALLLDGPNNYIATHEKEYSPHGYVTLTFDGDQVEEEYYEPGGTLLHRETPT